MPTIARRYPTMRSIFAAPDRDSQDAQLFITAWAAGFVFFMILLG